MVAEEERKFKESKENLNICLDIGKTLKDSKRELLGYIYLDKIYDFLELDNFFGKIRAIPIKCG